MRNRWSKISPFVALVIALVTVTAATADYTGPNRSYQRIVDYSCEYVARLYWGNTPLNYYCTLRLREPSCDSSNKSPFFNPTSCVGWPAGCNTTGYSCRISITSSTPNYEEGTYPPATSTGSFGCSTWGNNGWCRAGARLNVSGYEPLGGYSIYRMEGNYTGGNEPAVNCSGSSCSFTPPQGQGTFYYWAVSDYGDTSLKNSLGYKFDSEAPSVSLSPSGTSGGGGWYRSNVTVTGSGSDAVSGLASLSLSCGSNPCTVTAEGTTTITATATDNAGNTASTGLTVRKDTTPPTIFFVPSGTAGNAGWYRSAVTLSATASDAHSGVSGGVALSCSSNPCTISAQGTTNVSGTVSDVAGNIGSNSITIRIDSVAPSVSLSPTGTQGSNGWYVSDVSLSAIGSDATSGVSSVQTRLNGGAWGGSSLTITADGVHTVEARAIDVAGNESNVVSITIRRDTTAPVINGLDISGTEGNNGWYRSPVDVRGLASDATSGVALVQVDGESNRSLGEGIHTVTVRAVDQAGNESTQTFTVRVDSTPPNLALQIPPADGDNGWYGWGASLDAIASDALSGLAEVRGRVNGGAWQSLPFDLTDEGVHAVEIEAEDEAGNLTRESLTIRIDRTAPTIEPSVPAADGKNGWYVSPFEVSYSTDDNLSGVRSSAWRVNGGDWQSGTPQIDGEGEITLDIRAVDEAGNERIRRYVFSLDQTPPQGEITLSGEAGVEDWYRSVVEASITGEDAVSGVAEMRLPQAVIETEGWHTVTGEVEDNAGWVQEVRRTFGIDLTPPVGGFDELPPIVSGVFTLQGDAGDALSGLHNLEISFSMGYQWQAVDFADDRWVFEWDTTQTNGGYKRIYLRLTDKAGNPSTVSVDALVSNALPQATITESWTISQSGEVSVIPGDLPIRQVCLTIQDPAEVSRKVEWCGESVASIPNPVRWDGRFADGSLAAPGRYPVIVSVTDMAGRTVTASGMVIIPSPTPTPTVVIPETGAVPPSLSQPTLAFTAVPTATPTAPPTATPTEEEREEPTHTAVAVSAILPTPQPTVPAVEPPKFEVQASVETVRRALWPFLTLLGLAGALGYSAMRDERPQAIRKLAERIERILDLQEVK